MTRRRKASISYLSSISVNWSSLALAAVSSGFCWTRWLLAVPGLFQAADLRVLVDRRQAVVVGIGLEAFGQDLFRLVEIAAPAINLGELDVGMHGRRGRP